MIVNCYVCREKLDTEVAHTYHAEPCALRVLFPCEMSGAICARLVGCGEDVHDRCCPTCTHQAF